MAWDILFGCGRVTARLEAKFLRTCFGFPGLEVVIMKGLDSYPGQTVPRLTHRPH